MNRGHYITHLDYEGYGNYEFAGSMGQSPGDLLQQLPGISELPPGFMELLLKLPSPEKMITVDGNIQVIKPEFRQTMLKLLDMMAMKSTSGDDAPTIRGEAFFVVGGAPTGWASQLIAAGYALMADKKGAAAAGGSVPIIATKEPEQIASAAASGSPYVVVDAPAGLIAAANAALEKPAGPGPAPAASSSTYGWWIAAAVAVGGVYLLTRKKKRAF